MSSSVLADATAGATMNPRKRKRPKKILARDSAASPADGRCMEPQFVGSTEFSYVETIAQFRRIGGDSPRLAKKAVAPGGACRDPSLSRCAGSVIERARPGCEST